MTDTQKSVAAIWRDLFKLTGVGPNDDFFDLGGDSLTGVALLLRVKETFGVELQLASLFEQSTITGLAQVIDLLVLTNSRADSATDSG